MNESEKKTAFEGVLKLICKIYNENAARYHLDKHCEDTLQDVILRCWNWFSSRYNPKISKPTTYVGNGVLIAMRSISNNRLEKKIRKEGKCEYIDTDSDYHTDWLADPNHPQSPIDNEDTIAHIMKHCDRNEVHILKQILKGTPLSQCQLLDSGIARNHRYIQNRVRVIFGGIIFKVKQMRLAHS